MPEVIGLEHIYLTVSDLEASERFYDQVMQKALGFRKSRFTLAGAPHIHYFNRHFGLVLRPSRVATPHDPSAPGLHHVCLRVDSAVDVRAVCEQLVRAGINATEARSYPEYAEDYVATFFEDPDGIRLEIANFRQERRDRYDHWENAR
jgi:catechol 2,3-dioxygenase-like lactoylglutathione lyase family enzyme